MSESDHEWCRDVRRDEAVRAAEDAAAVPSIQHRDLPEVVAALTERVARLEAAARADRDWDALSTLIISECDAARAECKRLRARVAELEAAPPPRGWLTAEERDLIAGLTNDDHFNEVGQNIAKALLARSTPPRVKAPHLDDLEADELPVWESACHEWIAAIRAAGGEVE